MLIGVQIDGAHGLCAHRRHDERTSLFEGKTGSVSTPLTLVRTKKCLPIVRVACGMVRLPCGAQQINVLNVTQKIVYTPEDITTPWTQANRRLSFLRVPGIRGCVPFHLPYWPTSVSSLSSVACDTTPPRRNVEARLLHGEEDAQSHTMRE